ncbi:MAG: hypothetical protein ABIW84_02985, partial [Ilumatobacteraceae bacterium]
MNTTKAHIAALSLLDRALIAISDDELKALLAALPDDHVSAVRRISGLRQEASFGAADTTAADLAGQSDQGSEHDLTSAPALIDDSFVDAVRAAAHKGRLNGDLQRLGVVMSDACLADCVTQLGDKAEMPTEDDLKEVLPGLVEAHGVGLVRLMLASTVVGEAPASATIVALLKDDELVALPPGEQKPLAPLLPLKQDNDERLRLKA